MMPRKELKGPAIITRFVFDLVSREDISECVKIYEFPPKMRAFPMQLI
jgi:hypothetical protein